MIKTFQFILPELFGSSPRLDLTRADLKTFKSFRALQLNLHSVLDEMSPTGAREEFFLLLCENEPVGCLSLVTQINSRRKGPRKKYARIDLVIIPKKWQGVGFGRVLLLSTLCYLLDECEKNLYSISCLASHPAVEKVLKQASFSSTRHGDENFTRQELKVDDDNLEALKEKFHTAAQEAIGRVNFRLRQEKNI